MTVTGSNLDSVAEPRIKLTVITTNTTSTNIATSSAYTVSQVQYPASKCRGVGPMGWEES